MRRFAAALICALMLFAAPAACAEAAGSEIGAPAAAAVEEESAKAGKGNEAEENAAESAEESAGAAEDDGAKAAEESAETLAGSLRAEKAERERPALDDVRVYVCSLLAGRAFIKGDAAYMSLMDMGEIYGVDIAVTVLSGSFKASAEGLEMSGEADKDYIEANCRYLYVPNGFIVCGEDVYLPLDALGRVFGLSFSESGERVDISTAEARFIAGGENYYELNFSAEELYWLPRLAYAEAYEQPLAGVIGVCNVVLNRVASEDFPDTIFEVVYETNNVVQFTPAEQGGLRAEPDEDYYIAAYLALEGYSTVGESLYFVNPDRGADYWFKENLSFVVKIGDHEFYK